MAVATVSYEDDLLAVRMAPLIVEAAPDAIVVVDRVGAIRIANHAAARLTGWPRVELLHRQVEDLLPEVLRGRHEQLRTAYMVTPVDRPMGQGLSIELLHRDGSLVPVEILLGVLEADDLYVVATIRRRGSP